MKRTPKWLAYDLRRKRKKYLRIQREYTAAHRAMFAAAAALKKARS